MLKSSSLCLYSSNLHTFWLKIKQFWTFEEINIFSNGGHLGWKAWLSDITFKGNPLRMIQAKFGLNWPSGFRGEDFLKSLQTDDGRQLMTIAHIGELKTGDELRCYGRVSSSCSTCGTHHVTLVTNPMTSHDYDKRNIYLCSFVTQILRNG